MPFEDRIFLEMKDVGAVDDGLGGHMYLVKRSVFVDANGAILSNDYNYENDQVIRGSAGLHLGTFVGLLGRSLDSYAEDETPQTRHSLDITALVGGIQNWPALAAVADAINADNYLYEAPYISNHTVNSNAVILTVLASVGVDVQDIQVDGHPYVNSYFPVGAPGANGGSATLLAVGDTTTATALHHDVAIVGRDSISDTFINTALNEQFYGEQLPSPGTDVVRYNSPTVGEGVDLSATVNSGYPVNSLRQSGSE